MLVVVIDVAVAVVTEQMSHDVSHWKANLQVEQKTRLQAGESGNVV